LTLVRLARGEGGKVKVSLDARREELVKIDANQNDRSPVRWSDALIARACLNDPALRGEIGEPMARSLINRSQRLQNGGFLSHLRRDLAAAQGDGAGSSASATPGDPGLAFWHPASLVDASTHAAGGVPPWWASSQGVIAHVTGPQDQLLLFD